MVQSHPGIESAVPVARRWFLESLLERSRPDGPVYWLRQITLECSDNMARHSATRLIVHGCCCGAKDPEESALLIAVDRATGRALHRWGHHATMTRDRRNEHPHNVGIKAPDWLENL